MNPNGSHKKDVFLAVGQAYTAILWPPPDFKVETFDSSGDFSFCLCNTLSPRLKGEFTYASTWASIGYDSIWVSTHPQVYMYIPIVIFLNPTKTSSKGKHGYPPPGHFMPATVYWKKLQRSCFSRYLSEETTITATKNPKAVKKRVQHFQQLWWDTSVCISVFKALADACVYSAQTKQYSGAGKHLTWRWRQQWQQQVPYCPYAQTRCAWSAYCGTSADAAIGNLKKASL